MSEVMEVEVEKIPQPPVWGFKKDGHRHSKDFLKEIYPDIIEWDVQEQCIYCDEGTYKFRNVIFVKHQLPTIITRNVFKHLNATSIGNIAFLSLYASSILVRNDNALFLKRVQEYYKENKGIKTFWQKILSI